MMLPKIVLALTLITVISITPVFAESIGIEGEGIMKVNHDGMDEMNFCKG